MAELRAHCERCCDDEDKRTQMQEKRMQEHMEQATSREAWKGERVEVMVEQVPISWEYDEEQGKLAGRLLGVRHVAGISNGDSV